MSFSRARVYPEVSVVWAGDDAVVFVQETSRYHTFSNRAFDIWQAVDGTRSDEDLAMLIYGDATEVSLKRIRIGLEQLAEAELLEEDDGSGFSRRQFAKLGAAAILAGLPVVTSITAPVAADGLSPLPVPTPPPIILKINDPCFSDYRNGVCEAGTCCCHPSYDLMGTCKYPNKCGGSCV